MNAKKKNLIKWIILLVLVLALAALIYFKFFYKPPKVKEVFDSTPFAKAQVGDVVSLGSYEQDNDPENGAEPIQWRVVARENDYLLVESIYGLEMKQYNESYENVTWATCTLRQWLNGEFYESAFSAEEKKKIALTHVSTSDNPKWGTDGGADTDDYLFLFSATETEQFFKAAQDEACKEREVKPTDAAIAHGVWRSGMEGCEDNCISWWLRSPGAKNSSVACVFGDGSILDGDQACYVTQGHYAVRPVLRIDING